jgi:hypothetical protein
MTEDVTPTFEMDAEEGQSVGVDDQPELGTEEEVVEPTPEELQQRLEAAEAERQEAIRERDGIYARLKSTESRHQKKLETLESRFDELTHVLNPPKTVEDELGPEPNKDESPVDWLDWRRRKDSLLEQDQRAQEQHNMRLLQKQNEEMEDLTRFAHSSENRFLSEEGAPEVSVYQEGIAGLKEQRFKQFVATGMTEQEAADAVLSDELAIIARAKATGMNPARVAWNLVSQSNIQVQPKTEARTNKAESEIVSMKKGQTAAGLGESPGGTTRGKITMERIAAMSEDEFNDFAANVKQSQWEELDSTGKMTL